MGELGAAVPKPMVLIGGKPILWHIMKLYASQNQTEFILALGWKSEAIKEFFLHYEALTRDFSITLGEQGAITYLGDQPEDGWKVTCVDTGLDTLTGTRVRLAARSAPEGPIMVTYGDGIGDIDIGRLVEFHRSHGLLATLTAVRPPGRFGELCLDASSRVSAFEEKPQLGSGMISGGFMIFEREAIDRYIPADRDVMLEREPLAALSAAGQLAAFRHDGFWQPMDTPREHDLLTTLWETGKAPWALWR